MHVITVGQALWWSDFSPPDNNVKRESDKKGTKSKSRLGLIHAPVMAQSAPQPAESQTMITKTTTTTKTTNTKTTTCTSQGTVSSPASRVLNIAINSFNIIFINQ